MTFKIIVFSCCLTLLILVSNAKRYQQCDLLKELQQKHHIKDKHEAAALTCLAYELSRYDTSYATADSRGRYFGIFILPENETCSFEKPGKCRRTCDKFLDDDITDDLKCLKETILTGDSAHNDELERCLVGEMVEKYLRDCEMDPSPNVSNQAPPKVSKNHKNSQKKARIERSDFELLETQEENRPRPFQRNI